MHSDQARATPRGERTGAQGGVGTQRPPSLRSAFSRFLHRRRRLGHFGRHPLQDALAGRGKTHALPDALPQDMLEVSRPLR